MNFTGREDRDSVVEAQKTFANTLGTDIHLPTGRNWSTRLRHIASALGDPTGGYGLT